MADTHRYVGNHAAEINGVMQEPGAFLSLDKAALDDPHIKDHIESGTIVDLKAWGSAPAKSEIGGDK